MTNSWSQINSDSAHLGLSLLAGMRWKELHAEARCKEKSPIIEGIVSEAKKSNDLVKFGMVLHAYADTFSHAGFSGLLSKINSIEELQATLSTPLIPSHLLKKWVLRIRTSKTGETMDRLLHSIVPSYGHGQALTYPDLPHLKWSYLRFLRGSLQQPATIWSQIQLTRTWLWLIHAR